MKQMKKYSILLCLLLTVSVFCPAEDNEPGKETEQITITAQREPLDPRNTTAQVTVITSEQIQAMGARNAAEIVATAPGVVVTSYGARAQSQLVSVRGSTADQVLVLINGKKINTAQGGGVDLSMINPDNIERVEIIRGGMSAVYGDGAFGGVINIVLKEGSQKELEIAGSYGFSSFNTHDLSASVGSGLGNEKRLDFNLALNGFYTDGEYDYYSKDYGEVLSRENAQGYGGGGTLDLGWDIFPDLGMRLALNGQIQGSRKGVPGMEQFASLNAEMEDAFTLGSVSYTWVKNPVASIELDFTGQHHMRHYTDPDWYLDPVDDTHINNAVSTNLKLSRKDKIGFLLLNHSAGYSYRNDFLDSTALVFSETEGGGLVGKYTHSGYYRSDLNLFPFPENEDTHRFIFSPSVRYDSVRTRCPDDDLDKFEDKLSWNAGWMINFDSNQNYLLKGNVGTAFHLPTFDDLFWPDTGFAMGNPNLKPENAFNIDAGLLARPFPFLSLELVYYRQMVEDLIQWTPGPGGVWRPRNIGQALLTGIETEAETLFDIPGISCYLVTSGNYTLLIAENREEGIALEGMQLIYRPKHQYHISSTLHHYQGHSLNISGEYTGYRYSTEGNTKYLDHYFLLNSTLSIRVVEGLDLVLYGKNLLNLSYVDRRQYPVPGYELGIKTRYTY